MRWGEGHVGFVEVDLLIGDFDHLILGHAGGWRMGPRLW